MQKFFQEWWSVLKRDGIIVNNNRKLRFPRMRITIFLPSSKEVNLEENHFPLSVDLRTGTCNINHIDQCLLDVTGFPFCVSWKLYYIAWIHWLWQVSGYSSDIIISQDNPKRLLFANNNTKRYWAYDCCVKYALIHTLKKSFFIEQNRFV